MITATARYNPNETKLYMNQLQSWKCSHKKSYDDWLIAHVLFVISDKVHKNTYNFSMQHIVVYKTHIYIYIKFQIKCWMINYSMVYNTSVE